MIDLEFVERLIRSMDDSSLDSIEIERGGTRIRLSKTPSSVGIQAATAPPPVASSNPTMTGSGNAPGTPSAQQGGTTSEGGSPADAVEREAASNLVEITSPMVGTFYRSPSPDADPFKRTGESIATGDVLCIIEAMKLMNELEAEVEGKIREICVENGEPVEYGQVLFRIEPS